MATTEQPYTRVAKAVLGDLEAARVSGAEEVLPKGGPGAGSTTRAQMIQHIRDLWPYPELRASLFQRVVPVTPNPVPQAPDGSDAVIPARNGVRHWEELMAAAFPLGWPEPPPQTQPMGGGFAPEPGFTPGSPVPY